MTLQFIKYGRRVILNLAGKLMDLPADEIYLQNLIKKYAGKPNEYIAGKFKILRANFGYNRLKTCRIV